VQDSLKELFSEKNHTEYTYRTHGNTNSDYFWLSAIGQATEEKDGSKTAYLLFNDATQAKRREAEFEQKIKDYTSFFPSAVTSFTLNLTQDNLTDLSSTMPIITQLIHGKNAGCIAAALENVISDEETKKNVPPQLQSQALLEAFRKGNSYLSFDHPLTLDNGDILWHQIIINMVENPTTGDVEAFGYSLDITEQKKDEQMIRYITEQKLDYVAIVDFRRSSLTIRNLNREMTKLGFFSNFAYSYAQFIRLISLGLPTPDDKKQFLALTDLATIHDSLKKSGKYSYSFPYLEEGNSTRKLVQVGWLDHKQDLAVYLRTDITEAYNREQDYLVKLKNALAIAEEANHAKSDFVSRISHDIRTPINIIKNMSDFALQDIDNREKLKDDLSKISSANMFLLSLINDVLDISKIDSGRIELHPEPYPYEEHERNIRNIGEPMAKAKGLTFIVQKRVHENDGCAVCDITRINQILLNLLSNAIKYTPEGGTVTYTSDSELLPNAQMRMGMIVSDTGIGMSEAFQKRLFQPFTQELDNPYRPKGMTGTGLGLSIVKRLVGLMNGTIEVRSQLGKGTTIQVNLIVPDATRDPKYKESLTDKAATEKAPPLKTSALQGKILLAEDNEINAEITERILGSFGLSADWAKNGKEAVDLFNQAPVHTYQAVLMDIQMPIMDGYEATRQIRALAKEDSKTVPIIAMTADAFNDAIEKGQQAGMNAHLTKPIDAEKTKQVLTDYLNK
jgi:signal transduction histidine kinase